MPVYIVRAVGTDRYKIGYSRNVERRKQEIETGATGKRIILVLTINSNIEAERVLHHRYKKRKEDLTGEWFRLSSADLQEIGESRAALEHQFPIPEQGEEMVELGRESIGPLYGPIGILYGGFIRRSFGWGEKLRP